MSNTISAAQLMMQMNHMKSNIHSPVTGDAQYASAIKPIESGSPAEQVNFSDLLGAAVKQVNSVQKHSSQLKKDFDMGKEGVDLVEVMITSEKSSVAFSALLETRNKLLKAYNEIISTPV